MKHANHLDNFDPPGKTAAHNPKRGTNSTLLESIPTVENLKLPFLLALKSGREILFTSVEKRVADHFGLSIAARKACSPGAKTPRFENRMSQARAQLHEENLIELPHHKKSEAYRKRSSIHSQ